MWRVEISFQILNSSDLHPQPDRQSDRTKLFWLLWKSNGSRNETVCVSWSGQHVKTFKASCRNLFSSWVNEAFPTGAVLKKFGRSRRMCPKHVWSCLVAVPSLIITKTTNSFVSLVSESAGVFTPASALCFWCHWWSYKGVTEITFILKHVQGESFYYTCFIWSCLFGLTCSFRPNSVSLYQHHVSNRFHL